MLENIGKLLDVLENLLSDVDPTDPAESNKLVEIGSRLEALVMEITDKTSAP